MEAETKHKKPITRADSDRHARFNEVRWRIDERPTEIEAGNRKWAEIKSRDNLFSFTRLVLLRLLICWVDLGASQRGDKASQAANNADTLPEHA